MKTVLTIDVKLLEPYTVQGHQSRITMLPFTGTASGPFFSGQTVGPCVDKQVFRTTADGEEVALSARYMLEGTDCTGRRCRIFIDNSRHDEAGWHPEIVTDSDALADWENGELLADVDPIPGGVRIHIRTGKA